MKNISKMPTFLGLIVLILGIVAGIVLLQGQVFFRLGATPGATPKDVRITNITDSSFSVSWVTEKEVKGFIKWDTSEILGRTEQDEIGKPSFTHTATIESLSPEKTYFFKINSGGSDYDNNGVSWQVKLGPSLVAEGDTNLTSGTVINSLGQPVKNALVYIAVGGGSPLSTLTSESGSYIISIASARTQALGSYIPIDNTSTLLEISVNTGAGGIASAQVYPTSARPVPPIILGQIHDFKNLERSEEEQIPEASLTLPEKSSPSSRFDVGGEAGKETKTVTLKSVDADEVVTTTEPEFFGEGPPGTTLTIAVESEIQTTQTKVSSSGEWNWTPTKGLSPGTHKITVTWRDTNGILRTLTRTFIVSASEGPAFEATPSASPSTQPSPSPSPSPQVSPSPLITPSATPSTVPDSGNLTPTLVLSMMGIGVLTLSVLLWNKANA